MDNFLKTADVAKIMGVSVESVRRFEKNGILTSIRTPYGHRRFKQEDVLELMSKGSLKAPKNNGNADEQGFGDEPEQTLTCKNIHFGSDEISSVELFRQQSEKAKVINSANVDQEANLTTGEILRQLKDSFDTSTKATNSVVEDTPIKAQSV